MAAAYIKAGQWDEQSSTVLSAEEAENPQTGADYKGWSH